MHNKGQRNDITLSITKKCKIDSKNPYISLETPTNNKEE